MYRLTVKRYNLLRQLRILFNILNFWGLTGIAFNQSNQSFVRPKCRQKVAHCVYKCIQYFSGFLIAKIFLPRLWRYTATSTFKSPKSVEAQEETISLLSYYIHTTSAFIYASYYFHIQGTLEHLLNKALWIFKKIKARTGPGLFLSSRMANTLLFKGVILIFALRFGFLFMVITILVQRFLNVIFELFPILSALMILSYIYIQLTLLCFYEKMIGNLRTFGSAMGRPELVKRLQEFMLISRQIHILKQRLNGFAQSVFISTYIGLFHDIQFIYLTLKVVFYSKYFLDYKDGWFHLNFHHFPACLSFTFDMYIIGLLSDLLEEANDEFQEMIVKLSEGTPSLHREVEVMLMQDNVCDLRLRACGRVKVNNQFSFDFMMNTVLVFVITFLQFFAAEQIYTKHFEKVTIKKEYIGNL